MSHVVSFDLTTSEFEFFFTYCIDIFASDSKVTSLASNSEVRSLVSDSKGRS